jgi:hypothetical protein
MTSSTRSRLTRATLAALLLATAFAVRSLALGPGQSFTFLASGFTQELIGATQNLGDLFDDDGDGTPDNILGGVAFAPDGDPVVTDCNFAGTQLHRFDRQSTTTINGTDVWPETILPSAGGCGIVNHPDGTAYIAMDDGVNGIANVDLETGALIGFMGPPSNALGIAVDPQTNDLVYAAADCRFTGTCTFIRLNTVTGAFSTFGVLPGADAEFVDGMYFDPAGTYLFLANRAPSLALTVLDRSGQVVQHVPMSSEPDGVAFHATSPKFVVTNNTDGTMTRFDFAGDDYTQPPAVTPFASGGFRGDLSQVGADGCIYLTQKGTRYNNGTEHDPATGENSVVRICGGFAPPPGTPAAPETQPKGSLAGTVFHDVDRDGVRDAGEPGIGDVTVTLTPAGEDPVTTSTAADGSYSFADLEAGAYSVSSPATTSGLALFTISPIEATLGADEDRTGVDFGYVDGSIAGYAYVDSNHNSLRDSGEPGIGGVAISIAGQPAPATTAADGSYLFAGLTADSYSVSAPATAAGRQRSTPSPLAVTLAAGEQRGNVDFGYVPGSISGFAYADANGNGVRDGGEAGIGGVTIGLSGGATATTAGDGSYTFPSLLAASYAVSAPATAGSLTRSTPSPLNVALAAGEHRTDVNFGYVSQPPSCPETTFDFSGSSPGYGAPGNVRTFSSGGMSVKASGWSATKAGSFSPAYLALYAQGLGVTDATEGDGSNNRHTVDNVDQNNYVLFAFDQPVVVDEVYLGYVVNDSDIRVWIGTIPNAYTTGVSLNGSVLSGLGFTEASLGGNAVRWADVNAGGLQGNVLVVAAKPDEQTDYVKIDKIRLAACPTGPAPLSLECVSNNEGTVGTPFSGALTASGGAAPYTFSIASGSLPAGLSLNPATGVISGTPSAAGTFNFTARVEDSTGGAAQSATVDCSITIASAPSACVQTTLTFTGNSPLNGTKGNIRSYNINGVPVRVSAFNRTPGGTWQTAYLGVWNEGFGVTAPNEDGQNGTHRVDNVGGHNVVLFEFASPVVVDYAYLNSVVTDSDISVLIGTFNNPYTNHLSLSDALLGSFDLSEDDDTTSSAARWASFNAGRITGNALVIAASGSDTSPDDRFKINKLYVCK